MREVESRFQTLRGFIYYEFGEQHYAEIHKGYLAWQRAQAEVDPACLRVGRD